MCVYFKLFSTNHLNDLNIVMACSFNDLLTEAIETKKNSFFTVRISLIPWKLPLHNLKIF